MTALAVLRGATIEVVYDENRVEMERDNHLQLSPIVVQAWTDVAHSFGLRKGEYCEILAEEKEKIFDRWEAV